MRLLIDLLATYRVTKLVLDDEIVSELREAWFERFPPESTKLGYLVTCPWCTSFWAGVLVFGLRRFAPEALADIVNGALAGSSVTGLLYEKV